MLGTSTCASLIHRFAFAVGKLKDQSKMFSIEVLLNMVEACAKTDELIKTGKINDRVGVELILIQFSQN